MLSSTPTNAHSQTHEHTNIHTCACTHTYSHTTHGGFEQSPQFLLPFILCVDREMQKRIIFISRHHREDNKMRHAIFCDSTCKHEWLGKSKTKGDICYVHRLRCIKSKKRNLYPGTGTVAVQQTLHRMCLWLRVSKSMGQDVWNHLI